MDKVAMIDVHESLKNLVERLHEAAKDNLESVILYGSAARADLHDAHSDLNILCVLRSLRVADLTRVSPVVNWWTGVQHQPAPFFFAAAELRHSADVFAIELLDMQRNHRVLYGSDIIAAISVPMNLHRVQVEHELRTLLLKLRQHFLRDMQHPIELGAVLAKSFSSALTLLRHTLIALQGQAPDAANDVLDRLAVLTPADKSALLAVQRLREVKTLEPATVASMYDGYLAALERVIATLNLHLPKHEWQRAGKASS